MRYVLLSFRYLPLFGFPVHFVTKIKGSQQGKGVASPRQLKGSNHAVHNTAEKRLRMRQFY